jgi:hypothetical protein
MASLTPVLKQRFFDANGAPLVGGKLYSYTAGTTTPRTTFTDQSGLVPNTNPVILDANAQADVWIGNGYYKFVLTNAADVVQYTIDRVATGTGGEIAVSDLAIDRFSGTGSQTVFTLTADPLSQVNTYVFVSGVYQQKDTYTLSGTTLTFSEAPPIGTNNIEVSRGTAMAIGTIGDLSITEAKIANGAVTNAKLLNASVTTEKIADLNVTTAKLADLSVTSDKIADGAITQSKRAALNIVTSGTAAGFSSTSTPFVDVTNLSLSFTSSGRPVLISLESDSSTFGSINFSGAGTSVGSVRILRGATVIYSTAIGSNSGTSQFLFPASMINAIDTPLASTNVYKVQVSVPSTSTIIGVNGVKLVAYEL